MLGTRGSARFGITCAAIAAGLLAFEAFPAPTQASRRSAIRTIAGTIEVRHADGLGGGQSGYLYSLLTDSGRRYSIFPGRDMPPPSEALSLDGAQVTVRGNVRGLGLQESALRVTREAPIAQAAGATAGSKRASSSTASGKVRRVAVINIAFPGGRSIPNETIASSLDELDSFLAESSGGSLDMSGVNDPHGDVFGPYEVQRTNPGYPTNRCDDYFWRRQAIDQAVAQGIDVDYPVAGQQPAYDSVVFVFPHSRCHYAGAASVGGGSARQQSIWLNGPHGLGLKVFGHEMGHNLGAMHASRTRGRTYSEYGDPFDIMGRGRTNEYNSFFKARMASIGSMPDTQFQYVTQPGTYTLSPNDGSLSGTQLLLIPRPASGGGNGPYIALEIRHAFGQFNTSLHGADRGVTARIVPAVDRYTYRNTLLMGRPVAPGQSFVDQDSGISFHVDSISAFGDATVTITPASSVLPQTEAPGALTATTQQSEIHLNWQARPAGSDLFHWEFVVYRNDRLLGSAYAPQFTDKWPAAGTSTYTVVQRDYWGNEGLPASVTASYPG